MPWIVREIGMEGDLIREIDVDAELTRVFAALLGEEVDDMIGVGFPLDSTRFERIKQLFGLDINWEDATWFLEAVSKDPSPPV